MILVTCSGTIGKTVLVPKHWDGWTVNQHVLRVVCDKSIAGYVYLWLHSKYGHLLINRNMYGSVVQELTDKQIAQVGIPMLKDKEKINEINKYVMKANELRYQAYKFEQDAIKMMNEEVIGIK